MRVFNSVPIEKWSGTFKQFKIIIIIIIIIITTMIIIIIKKNKKNKMK